MMTVLVFGDRLDLADELEEQFHQQAIGAVSEAADMVLGEIQRRLSLRRGTAQTAAPEGEPPEHDTGALLRSWKTMPAKVEGRMVVSGVKSNHPGASRLEFGFTDSRGIRTLPHPYIAPSFAAMEGPIERLLAARFA